MKHYIGKIEERNGDMEYDTQYVFQTEGDPDAYTKKVAEGWRGGDADDWDEEHQGYWSDATLIFDDGSCEISQSDFDVLKKYLPIL